jgi:hypothetical protein
LLEAFALDASEETSPLASLASRDLTAIEDNWGRVPAYIYPFADEERSRVIAASNTYGFIFDGKWKTAIAICVWYAQILNGLWQRRSFAHSF